MGARPYYVPQKIYDRALMFYQMLDAGIPFNKFAASKSHRFFVKCAYEARLVLAANPDMDKRYLLSAVINMNAKLYPVDNASSTKCFQWALWLLNEYLGLPAETKDWKAEYVRNVFSMPELKFPLEPIYPFVKRKTFSKYFRCPEHGVTDTTYTYFMRHHECKGCHDARKATFDKQLHDQYSWAKRFESKSYGSLRYKPEVPKSKNHRYTNEEVVEQLRSQYGDDCDYSQVEYVDIKSLLKITCLRHNHTFTRTFQNLRNGAGCPKCRAEKGITWKKDIQPPKGTVGHKQKHSQEQFEADIRQVHGNHFDLSEALYQGSKVPVKVICTKCGESYMVRPDELRRRYICSCWRDAMFEDRVTSPSSKLARRVNSYREKFGERFLIVKEEVEESRFGAVCFTHGHYIDYSVILHGCPVCFSHFKSKGTKGEQCISEWLTTHRIDFTPQYEMSNGDRLFYPDFYLPSYKMVVEFNGPQHYEPIPFYHPTYDDFIRQVKRDDDLKDLCARQGIKVLSIHYDDQDRIPEILSTALNVKP